MTFIPGIGIFCCGEKMVSTWLETVASLIEIIRAGIDGVRAIIGDDTVVAKVLTIKKIQEQMTSGSLNIGDRITCLGTFSPYMPFVDLRTLIEGIGIADSSVQCTCRLDSINNVYCGALYDLDQNAATTTEVSHSARIHRDFWTHGEKEKIYDPNVTRNPNSCIPVFYSKIPEHQNDRGMRLSNYGAGDVPELTCEIRELPDDWKRIIKPATSFTFADSQNRNRPFCLKVLDAKPYGIVLDEFKIDVWVASHMNTQIPQRRPHSEGVSEEYLVKSLALKYNARISNVIAGKLKLNDSNTEYETVLIRVWAGPCVIAGFADINVLDPLVVKSARESLPRVIKHYLQKETIVDFQYDQIDPMCEQMIEVSEIL